MKNLVKLKDRWLYVLVAGHIIFYLPGLFLHTLWLDEAYSAVIARRSIYEIWNAMRFDAGPPLYYYLLHGWRVLAGESEAVLRAMSLLFGVLTTVCIYSFASRYFKHATAMISSLLWIVSPLVVYNTTQVRNYALLAFLSVSAVYVFCHVFFEGKKKVLPVLILILTLLVYTHNVGWFLILALGLASLFHLRTFKNQIYLSLSFVIVIGLYVPWITILLKQLQNAELIIGWVEKVWSPDAIVGTMNAFIPGGTTPAYIDLPVIPSSLHIILMIVWLIPLIYLLLRIGESQNKKDENNQVTQIIWLLLSILVIGVLAPYIYSLIWQPIYLVGRTDFFLMPIWCMLMGCALSTLKRKPYLIICLAAILIQCITLSAYIQWKTEPYSEREITRYLNRHGSASDVILCTGLTRPQMEYYFEPIDYRFVSYPLHMADHLAHFNEEWYIENTNPLEEAQKSIQRAKSLLSSDTNLWVIASKRKINEALIERLNQDTQLRCRSPIQTPKMGLRKLNEPLFIIPCTLSN